MVLGCVDLASSDSWLRWVGHENHSAGVSRLRALLVHLRATVHTCATMYHTCVMYRPTYGWPYPAQLLWNSKLRDPNYLRMGWRPTNLWRSVTINGDDTFEILLRKPGEYRCVFHAVSLRSAVKPTAKICDLHPESLLRHRLNGYLAWWVPSPPGSYLPLRAAHFKHFLELLPRKKTRYPLG